MNRPRILLDTCAVIWLAEGIPLRGEGRDVVGDALEAGETLLVSPVSAWEVGMLSARGRVNLAKRAADWFTDVISEPIIELDPLSTDILAESSFLPGKPPRDPADRIFAAQTRERGRFLVTRDRELLAYGGEGHMRVAAC
ncbi:MAG: type II toxin-antitoxin system VapC family toxin [Pseudomonadota bacterium]